MPKSFKLPIWPGHGKIELFGRYVEDGPVIKGGSAYRHVFSDRKERKKGEGEGDDENEDIGEYESGENDMEDWKDDSEDEIDTEPRDEGLCAHSDMDFEIDDTICQKTSEVVRGDTRETEDTHDEEE
ncbi:hypothetical protein IQ06DRAFT_299862 [Phaeosphaeriaceae sp. SRC1lsM3a]|nr:hypothetical protein IQ06DRAFT_299862 [Stagonospora sp. SRC1lsM3a]